jgi:hypothetical protein
VIEIESMEAGPACDMAVGHAVGLPLSGNNRTGVSLVLGDGGECAKFQPSKFWNDAMYAAERFRLFDIKDHWAALVHFSDEGVWQVQNSESLSGVVGSAPTGPLAICRAILKLSEGKL